LSTSLAGWWRDLIFSRASAAKKMCGWSSRSLSRGYC